MLRSQIGPNSLSSALRSIVVQIDPDLPLRRLMSMEDMIEMRTGAEKRREMVNTDERA